MISINTILTYILFTVLPGLVLAIWNDYKKKINALEKRVVELERCTQRITKDDIRQIIQDEFTKFELRLINQGRLIPEKE